MYLSVGLLDFEPSCYCEQPIAVTELRLPSTPFLVFLFFFFFRLCIFRSVISEQNSSLPLPLHIHTTRPTSAEGRDVHTVLIGIGRVQFGHTIWQERQLISTSIKDCMTEKTDKNNKQDDQLQIAATAAVVVVVEVVVAASSATAAVAEGW